MFSLLYYRITLYFALFDHCRGFFGMKIFPVCKWISLYGIKNPPYKSPLSCSSITLVRLDILKMFIQLFFSASCCPWALKLSEG